VVVQRFGTLPTVSHDHQLEDNILETQRQNQVNLAIIFGLVMTCGFKDVDVYEQLWDLGPGHHFLIFFGQVCDFLKSPWEMERRNNTWNSLLEFRSPVSVTFILAKKRVARCLLHSRDQFKMG